MQLSMTGKRSHTQNPQSIDRSFFWDHNLGGMEFETSPCSSTSITDIWCGKHHVDDTQPPLDGSSVTSSRSESRGEELSDKQRLKPEGGELAKFLVKLSLANPQVYEGLMAVEDPRTSAVLYLQLCVLCEGTSNRTLERKRDKLFSELDGENLWKVDQLRLNFTHFLQKVQVLQTLLREEERLHRSLHATHKAKVRCAGFWPIMSKSPCFVVRF